MAYVPPKKIKIDELQMISRAFGINVDRIIETATRVESQRCETCGSLSCAHNDGEVR